MSPLQHTQTAADFFMEKLYKFSYITNNMSNSFLRKQG